MVTLVRICTSDARGCESYLEETVWRPSGCERGSLRLGSSWAAMAEASSAAAAAAATRGARQGAMCRSGLWYWICMTYPRVVVSRFVGVPRRSVRRVEPVSCILHSCFSGPVASWQLYTSLRTDYVDFVIAPSSIPLRRSCLPSIPHVYMVPVVSSRTLLKLLIASFSCPRNERNTNSACLPVTV